MPDLKNNAVVRFRNMLIEMQLEQADIVGAITITNEDTDETMTVELPTASAESLPETEGPVSNAIVRFSNLLIEMQLSQDEIEGYVKITDEDSAESIIVQLPTGDTPEPLPDPYYELPTPKTFASLTDAVNTGILINQWADYDYTIAGEFVGTDHGSGQKNVFSSVETSSPWFGLGLIQVGDSMRVFAGNGDVNTSVSTANETHIKFVIRHPAEALTISADFYADDNRYNYSVNTKNNVSNNEPLKVGKHATGSPFIGTIYDFKVYKDLLFTDEDVTNYLGG